jgi:RES domain-containing protein
LSAWRLDDRRYATTWDSGEGARLFGGRWNSKGVRAVYCGVDPATAILEVAVHKGFRVLDTVPHVLTGFIVRDPMTVRVVQPSEVPNPAWLRPGTPGAGQQAFGDGLLRDHRVFVIPSAVSARSWNLVFDADQKDGLYDLLLQEAFALDTRLHPPTA